MQVLEAIYQRRSVRAYAPEALGDDQVRHLLDAAVQAPNAVNRQPWHFTVVRDRSLLRHMSDRAKTHVLENAREAMGLHGFEKMLRDPAFEIFYGAPALVVISATDNSDWAVTDCTLAAQTLMLAAAGEGLGSCWVGFAQAWLQTRDGKAALRLGEDARPVAPIILGRPAAPVAPVPRSAPIIHWIGAEAQP